MSIVVYGISNCDQVRKARRWLEAQHLKFVFHDVRKDGLSAAQVQPWLEALGWEKVVNKRSTAWRALSEEDKAQMDDHHALKHILATPTLIKRPLLAVNEHYLPGFNETAWREALQ